MKLDLDSGMHNFTGIKVNHDSDVSLATTELSTISYFLKNSLLRRVLFLQILILCIITNEQTVTLAWETYQVLPSEN